MRLELTEDQQFYEETVRRFVETETPMDVVRELHDHPDGFDRVWWQSAAELGWTSLLVSEAHGGGSISGQPPADVAIVAECMGRGVAPGPLMAVNVVAETLSRSGSDHHHELLGGVLSGETLLAWAFCEPAGDWSADHVAAEASPDNDGYQLTGIKTAVEAGAQAHHLLVTARSPDGLVQFLLPADTPGVRIVPQKSLDLGRRFAQVHLEQVHCGPDTVVGAPGAATEADVQRQRHMAMLLQCAEASGAAARCLEFTVEYAFDRFSFGRPLVSYQALKHRFADLKLWLESCHASVDGAADALASGDTASAAHMTSVAKSYVGEYAAEIIQDCVQLHGGIGVTWEHDLHLYLRRVTVNRGLFGAPTDHRRLLATACGL